jgi:hypothetical protein
MGGLVYPAFKESFPGSLVPFGYERDAGHDAGKYMIQI